MQNERWEMISRLFETALTLNEDERPAFLKEACAGDAALLREVTSLLHSDSDIHDVLQTSILKKNTVDTDYSGRKIGAYRIERLLAAGGMGKVFLAARQDGTFNKQVAIKIIHAGLKSTQFIERFRQERQILAALNHPNIASLIDGGLTEDGTPYLIMEFVDGIPINHYLETEQPDILKRLDLFHQICDAVGYAHRHLVIHRDLKPGNIFVDSDGRVRLLDFGIAKVFDIDADTVQTLLPENAAPYTPQYASPEQIEGGPISTQSDVYALGVILYEMLSGQLPYSVENKAIWEIREVIKQEIPILPSIAAKKGTAPYPAKRLKGDLDNICLKMLKKEPELRYESVAELQNDIKRHLADLPVRAANDNLRYRFAKFIGRHRVAAGLSFTFSIVLMVVIIIYTGQLREETARARAEMQKSSQVADFLIDLFDAAGPQSAKGKDATALDLLQNGAEKIEKSLLDQPGIQAEMFGVIGDVYRRIGSYKKAVDLKNKALEKSITLYGPKSEATARQYFELAVLYEELNDVKQAGGYFEKAQNLAHYVKIKPETFIGDILLGKADLSYQLGQFKKSDSLYRASYKRFIREGGAESVAIASALNGMAAIARRLGRYAEAEKLYLRTLKMRKKLLGDDHADVAHTLNHLARLFSAQHRYKEAEGFARQGLAIRLAIYGENHAESAASMANLAGILRANGTLMESEKYYRKVLPILEGLFGMIHPYIAGITNSLGSTLYKQGKLSEAEKMFRQSIRIGDRVFPADHVSRAYPLLGLGRLLLDRHKNRQALPMLKKAYELRKKSFGTAHLQTADAANMLARCYLQRKNYPMAKKMLTQSLKLYEKQSNAEGLAFAQRLYSQLPKNN